jgi:hypothetical protein
MTDPEREALLERMRIAIGTARDCDWPGDQCRDQPDLCTCRDCAVAALTAAEPVVRADEREACIVNARTALDRFGAWNGSITPDKLMKPIEKRIRARGDA